MKKQGNNLKSKADAFLFGALIVIASGSAFAAHLEGSFTEFSGAKHMISIEYSSTRAVCEMEYDGVNLQCTREGNEFRASEFLVEGTKVVKNMHLTLEIPQDPNLLMVRGFTNCNFGDNAGLHFKDEVSRVEMNPCLKVSSDLR